MENLLTTILVLLYFLFPIWVAIHANRKGRKTLAIIIGISFLIPFAPLGIAVVAFFLVKPYDPNWDYIPNPSNFAGCGTCFYSATKKQADSSFITTQWFTIFYIPILPIQSYRVIKGAESSKFGGVYITSTSNYIILEKLKLERSHLIRAYVFVLSFIIIIASIFSGISSSGNSDQFAQMASSAIMGMLVVYAIIGYFLFRAK
ncbi:MAG TPA: hypothetical protein DCG75_06350 [Bacteroidales bacterium]|nr:hypothetical protein [Bacteroidales bacterium]